MAAVPSPRRTGSRSPAKRGRLSRAAEFERVYRQGRSHANRHVVLHAFPRPAPADDDAAPPAPTAARLGLSVSRKVGGAVQRNLVKRLLREAWAREGSRAPAGLDVVVVARPAVLEVAERDGLAGVHAALRDVVDRIAEPSPTSDAPPPA